MASWSARALITVASIPIVSEVARSRPWPSPCGSPPDVPAADHHGELEIEKIARLGDLSSRAATGVRASIVSSVAEDSERLTRHLDDQPAAPSLR